MADKPLVLIHGEIKTPPLSTEARRHAGFLLRMLQQGQTLTMPDSRPMPTIDRACHELRVQDAQSRLAWRIIYRVDEDAIVVAEVFAKKTQRTPDQVLDRCRRRFKKYDADRKKS